MAIPFQATHLTHPMRYARPTQPVMELPPYFFDYRYGEVEKAQALYDSFRRHVLTVAQNCSPDEWVHLEAELQEALRRNTRHFSSDLRDALIANGTHLLVSQRRGASSANRVALELLKRMLDARQASQLERLGWFTLRGSQQGLYQVRMGTVFNIDRLRPDGTPWQRLCAVPDPTYLLPLYDTLVAQVMWLRADEGGFLFYANRAEPVPGQPAVPLDEMPR